ncbi:MAG: hypothetical protein ABL958_10890 [Bdellovibrionia bacterium]
MFFTITTFVCSAAWGQAEVLLLNQNNAQTVETRAGPDATGSGRYTVKPRPIVKPKPSPLPTLPPIPKNETETEKKPDVSDAGKNLEQATTLPLVAPDPADSPDKIQNENILVRARDALMGGSPEILDEYRSYLQPDDVRRNIIEIRIAPIFIYNDSQSPSFARSYNGFSPGLFFSNDIWFTMFFGLNTTYRSSIGGVVTNDVQGTSSVAASHEWASIGLRFRRFYGFGKSVPSLEMGLDLREYNFRVPSDDPNRIKLKSTSAFLSLDAKVPANTRYTSVYSLGVAPWTGHTEATSGAAVLSGGTNSTFILNAGLGGEYKLDRTSRIFWKLDYEIQRSLFGGPASGNDPVTGTTLTNVPASNGFLIFHFGYTWAK